nr:unnamed protein product [Leishmania braziliensis]
MLGFGGITLIWYTSFVYVDHQDKDVSLKRHNKRWVDRAVNRLNFCVDRRCANFQCRLWKLYFSLQLVPADVPLPLLLLPEETGDGE